MCAVSSASAAHSSDTNNFIRGCAAKPRTSCLGFASTCAACTYADARLCGTKKGSRCPWGHKNRPKFVTGNPKIQVTRKLQGASKLAFKSSIFWGGAFWRPKGLTTFPQFQDSAGMGNNTETARVRACGFIRNLSGAVRVGGMGGGSWRWCCCVVSACTNQRPISNSKTRAQKASTHESTHERRKAEQHEAQAAQSTKA